MVYIFFFFFFDKKTAGSGLSHNIKSMAPNEQLAEEFHESIVKKIRRRKIYLPSFSSPWAADLSPNEQLAEEFHESIVKKN